MVRALLFLRDAGISAADAGPLAGILLFFFFGLSSPSRGGLRLLEDYRGFTALEFLQLYTLGGIQDTQRILQPLLVEFYGCSYAHEY